MPFFRPLPLAIAEHLAAELKPASYQPGDVIIREGQPGDRFYLIESGRARATADGRHPAELGPAGWFGEIRPAAADAPHGNHHRHHPPGQKGRTRPDGVRVSIQDHHGS